MNRTCLYSYLLKLVFLLSTSWITESSVPVARLEVAIYQFENNLNYRFRSDCCLRPSEGCDSQCDLTFRLCFRPFDAEEREELEDKDETICELGSMNVSRKDVEKKSGKESYLRKSMNILDRWPTLYTMILEVFDAKSDGMSTSTYLVDRTLHRDILLPSTPSQWQSIVVESTSSTYRLSMRLVCTPHHFGLKCAVECQPQAGQYTCDRHGNRVCEKGWSGENCDRPMCRKGCHPTHGGCKSPGECICVNGWKGELCDECITYPGCQHGTCDNAPFTCHCLPNWGGAFCDQGGLQESYSLFTHFVQ